MNGSCLGQKRRASAGIWKPARADAPCDGEDRQALRAPSIFVGVIVTRSPSWRTQSRETG